jgi:predicted PurR-regulated permease PerM
MDLKRITEYIFFFGLLLIVGYIAWSMMFPFVAALVLSAIIVILCYPIFEFILRFTPRKNRTVAALLSTLIAFFAIVIPVFFLSTILVNEFVSFYASIESSNELAIDGSFSQVEVLINEYIPGFEFSVTDQIKQSGAWLAKNIGVIFAGTVSVVFIFLISLMGSFYLFRDGKEFIAWVVEISPLADGQDDLILQRISRAIRSIATGTLLLSILQGMVAAIGFSLFGIDRPILWGSVAALGALLPGIGTAGIMVPFVSYLVFIGNVPDAIGLVIWAIASIAIIDNMLGPYLMSRGNNLHPFVVLLSVLGGISVFGPIGFIIGPVVISLFVVLLEIYMQIVAVNAPKKSKK